MQPSLVLLCEASITINRFISIFMLITTVSFAKVNRVFIKLVLVSSSTIIIMYF